VRDAALGSGQRLQVSKPGRGSSAVRSPPSVADLLAIGLRYMFHEHMNTIRNLLMYRNYSPPRPVDVIGMSSTSPNTVAGRQSRRRSAHVRRLLKVRSSGDGLALDQHSTGGHR